MLTKNETQQFKGAAILIMVFLHLFNQAHNVALCETPFRYLGEPVVLHLSKLTQICVGLYLFLSSYGLYISYRRSSLGNPWKRVLKLYLNFWVVFALFISLAAWVRPDRYPGSWGAILQNFTGWHTTYNGEWWFLFPYILLVLTASFLFKWMSKVKVLPLLLLTMGGYCLVYLTMWFNRDYLYSHQLAYMPILYLNCIPSFILGALFAREDWFAKLRERVQIKNTLQNTGWLLLFAGMVFLRSLSPVDAVNFGFLVFFVCWFALVRKAGWVAWLLEKLGAQSTNMWLVHTFFCYYLFHDWIYGLKYPIVIFVVTVLLSYASGILIDWIAKPLQRIVINKLFK